MHGADGGEVLLDDGLGSAPAFGDVAMQAADEAQVGVGVYEDFDVKQLAEADFAEDEDAFDDDDPVGLNGDGAGRAGVGGEVVNGEFDGVSLAELLDMVDQQVGVEGVGVVEVDFRPLLGVQVAEVFVIGVVGQVGDPVGAHSFENDIGYGGFAGAGAARDTDNEGSSFCWHGGIIS